MPSERKSRTVQRTSFHDPFGDMILQSVEQHWRSLRKGADVPQRIDFMPGPMSECLAHCFYVGTRNTIGCSDSCRGSGHSYAVEDGPPGDANECLVHPRRTPNACTYC